MFEVKSKTDSLPKLRQKIQEFLALGKRLGVLVDPRSRTMEVYRPGVEKVVLRDGYVRTFAVKVILKYLTSQMQSSRHIDNPFNQFSVPEMGHSIS